MPLAKIFPLSPTMGDHISGFPRIGLNNRIKIKFTTLANLMNYLVVLLIIYLGSECFLKERIYEIYVE